MNLKSLLELIKTSEESLQMVLTRRDVLLIAPKNGSSQILKNLKQILQFVRKL